MLRRIERRAVWLTMLAISAAVVVPGGGARAAAGVAGGALLAATSYWAIRRGITGIADAARSPATAGKTARAPSGMGALVLRYALLAGIAYVMIARLRMSPIGLLGGASMIVVAVAVEALRRPR